MPILKYWSAPKRLNKEFLVCENINNNIMGINLANALELSYDACTQQLFSIAPIDNSLVTHRGVLLPALSTSLVSAKFTGEWEEQVTYVAILYNQRTSC